MKKQKTISELQATIKDYHSKMYSLNGDYTASDAEYFIAEIARLRTEIATIGRTRAEKRNQKIQDELRAKMETAVNLANVTVNFSKPYTQVLIDNKWVTVRQDINDKRTYTRPGWYRHVRIQMSLIYAGIDEKIADDLADMYTGLWHVCACRIFAYINSERF